MNFTQTILRCAFSLALVSSLCSGLHAQEAANPAAPPGAESGEPTKPPRSLPPGLELPKLIRKVDAEYTEKARRAGFSGTVPVSFTVNEQGIPVDLRVEQSPGYDLDKAAMVAVKQYRFMPATQDGKPIQYHLRAVVSFTFHKAH